MGENRIRDAIARSGRTQQSVAAEIGLEPDKLSKSIAGVRGFKDREIEALSTALGVSSAQLLRGSDEGEMDEHSPLTPENRILDSAAELIATQGFHAVRISDIARACNVSSGTIHYYFPSKDAVLASALHYYAERMFTRLQSELDELAGDPVGQIRHLIDSQLPLDPMVRNEWSVWVQFWTEAMLVPGLRPAHNDLYERWKSMVLAVVVTAQDAQVTPVRDPRRVTSHFTTLIDGAAIQLLTGAPGMNIEMMQSLLSQVFWPEDPTQCDVAPTHSRSSLGLKNQN